MAAETTVSAHEWDYSKLQEELQKHAEIRDGLVRTTQKMQLAAQDVEKMLQNVPNEDNVWKDRYLQQQAHNSQMEAQLKQIERKLADLKSQHEVNDEKGTQQGYDNMSDVSLRQLLRKLEKEKAEIEWQLREIEWRLDQEAAAVYRAEEEKKAILTELGQASVELENNKRKQVVVSKAENRKTVAVGNGSTSNSKNKQNTHTSK